MAKYTMLGVFNRSDLISHSGYELMSAVRNGDLPVGPIYRELNIVITSVGDGTSTIETSPEERYFNPLGSIHGGYIATILDMCMGCSVHTKLPSGSAYTTVDLTTNFVRAVGQESGTLQAIGNVIHAGRQIITAEGRLFDGEKRLCAHGVSTSIVFKV